MSAGKPMDVGFYRTALAILVEKLGGTVVLDQKEFDEIHGKVLMERTSHVHGTLTLTVEEVSTNLH